MTRQMIDRKENSMKRGFGKIFLLGLIWVLSSAFSAEAATLESFSWVGKGSDRVGDWGRGTPDGRPDGHFQVRLNIPGQREVQSIAVYSSDASGNPVGGQVWHSRETRWWMLGVFRGGRQLNQSHISTLGPYSGQVLFDLFCNDSGWFKEGQHFLVEVTFGDGNKVRSVVRLGAVGVVPPPPVSINLTGRWRCNDGGSYYLRQVGNELWWYGASGDAGRSWTNVFHGRMEGNQANGRWADVPPGRIMNAGEMRIEILSPNHFRAIHRTGGFGGSDWTR
jgi:hypothetical protein